MRRRLGRTAIVRQMPAMNVVVCVKQIPDPAEPGKLEGDNTLDRSGKLILDESDSYGVEMALQLVDKAGGGEVTLVSMAPNNETGGPAHRPRHGCRQGHPRLRSGAVRAPARLDTAKVLAAAIKRPSPTWSSPPRSRATATRAPSRADRRAARPAVDHLRQGGRTSTGRP